MYFAILRCAYCATLKFRDFAGILYCDFFFSKFGFSSYLKIFSDLVNRFYQRYNNVKSNKNPRAGLYASSN